MPRRGQLPRRAVHLAGGLAVCALLVSCVANDDQAAPEATPSPPPGSPNAAAVQQPTPTPSPSPAPPPEAGACRRIAAKDLRTIVNDDPRVPCTRRHTAITFDVRRLPLSVARGATSAGDSRVENAADRICGKAIRRYVGGDRVDRQLSMLTPTYFLPSQEQFDLGARWVRCDVYAYATPDRLATLPRSLENALERDRVRSDFGRCSRVSPNRPRFRHIICARPHRWRAVDTLVLGSRTERFPGRSTVQARARNRCESRVREYLDTQEAFSYGFEVPERAAWADGDRAGYCWARTSE